MTETNLSDRILIVEDDANDRAAIRQYLTQSGRGLHDMQDCATGAEALAACRVQAPAGILLDNDLPDMSGLEFLLRLRAAEGAAPAPVIMLTATGDEALAAAAIKAGAHGYLSKQKLSPQTLAMTLDGAVERFELLAEQERQRRLLAETNRTLTMALAAADAGAWSWNIQSGAIHWSPENYALYGLDPEAGPPTYEDWEGALHPDDVAPTNAAIQSAVDGRGREFRTEFRIRHPVWGERWLLGIGRVDRDAQGEALFLSGINIDVTNRKRAELALRESEARLSLALSASATGVWDWDLHTDVVSWSPEAFVIHALDSFEGTGAAFFRLVHPEDAARVRATVEAAIDERKVYNAEFRIVRPDGTLRWVSNLGRVFYAAGGKPERVLGTITDITDRRLAEERGLLLARELDHRARNMLMLAQSIVRITQADSVGELKQALSGRFMALTRAHALLSQGRWNAAEVRRLVAEELEPYRAADPERMRIEGPDIYLSSEAAQTFAMAVHELASNSAKYGALSAAAGRLDIGWSRAEDDIVFRWIETGGPSVKPPTRQGFGSAVIQQSIEYQLEGQVRLDWRPEGLSCVIRLPGTLAVRPLEP